MKAYLVDLGEEMVAVVRRGMLVAQAARTFSIGATSVKFYVKLAEKVEALAEYGGAGGASALGGAIGRGGDVCGEVEKGRSLEETTESPGLDCASD